MPERVPSDVVRRGIQLGAPSTSQPFEVGRLGVVMTSYVNMDAQGNFFTCVNYGLQSYDLEELAVHECTGKYFC